MELNKKLKAVIPGCDVKKCKFEKKGEKEQTNERISNI
jgi:hypothetical protein